MRLLLLPGDNSAVIQKHITELVGYEMSPTLYPILFDQIKAVVDKFFDQQGQVRGFFTVQMSIERKINFFRYFQGVDRSRKYAIYRTSGLYYENGSRKEDRRVARKFRSD